MEKENYFVTGIFEFPPHFHLDFNYLLPLAAADIPAERMERWTWSQFYTYVKVKPGTNANQLEKKLQAFIKNDIVPQHMQDGSTYVPFFQPLRDIHLSSSDFVYDKSIRGNETYVKGLTLIALFVLVIACFNFVNLSTAKSFRRAREIGVRKVVGAERSQLIFQFLSETMMLAFLSVLLAIAATFIIIPLLNNFTGKSILFNPFTQPVLAGMILVGTLVLGMLAGIYPALVLSGFQPIKVLKSISPAANTKNTRWLRQALVVVQFALSGLLIVSSTIVYRQISFLNTKDVGFEKEQLVFFEAKDSIINNIETFKNELKRSPSVISVTSGYGLPGDQYAGDQVTVSGSSNKTYPANVFIGDHDYVKTIGLKVIAGRDFSREMSTDADHGFIINETAVKEFGLKNPAAALGKDISWEKWEPDSLNPVKKGKIIGVIQDFHYKSLHEKVTATVLQIYPPVLYKVAVKIHGSDLPGTLSHISNIWNKFSPGYPMEYKFMDETFGDMYKSEVQLSKMLWIFTLMAIIVGCMGLFALAAFSAEQRTKEIGIRKVLGANAIGIIIMLSKTFLKPVLIASLIAFPLAWWAMNKWLEDFAYRINIGWSVFIIATVIALLIAWITVSFQAIKLAVINPVKSLRTE
jgi:putative ABC transport system permease protein